MLLTVDIGNTATKFGLFEGEELVEKFSVPTHSADLMADIKGRLDSGFDSAIACSVVPDAAERLRRLVASGFGVIPTFVSSDTDLGLKIRQDPISSLGADRLVNCFAASNAYGAPVMVISVGTAVTIDLVSAGRELLGGLIAPGPGLMALSLREHTAKLPEIEVGAPPDEILGRNTADAIRSGIYLSQIGFIETAVARIAESYGDPQVIATGGFARMLASDCAQIDVVDEDLTLNGLRLIANRDMSASSSATS